MPDNAESLGCRNRVDVSVSVAGTETAELDEAQASKPGDGSLSHLPEEAGVVAPAAVVPVIRDWYRNR